MDVSFLKRWLQVLIDDFWEEFFGLTFLEDRNGSYGYHLSVVVCGLKEFDGEVPIKKSLQKYYFF